MAQTSSSPTVPEAVVREQMAQFEKNYNANRPDLCAKVYTAQCDVSVNEGSVFSGSSPAECQAFLDGLRNKLGGTNMKMTVTSVEGNVHKDEWTADNGTGTCCGTWEQQADGSWLITKDVISFTPKA